MLKTAHHWCFWGSWATKYSLRVNQLTRICLQPVCGMHFNNNPRHDVKARVFTKCFCFCYCATRSMDVFPFWLFMSQPAECAALAVQPEGRLTCRTLRKERAHTLARSYTLIHTLTHFQSYYKCTHARRGAMQVQLL